MYNGILVLDKIYGAPSRGCVTEVGKLLGGRSQKIGHAGTLDTTASGVLVLLAGNATRLSDAVMNMPKSYLASVTFGWETSTDDATGAPCSEPLQKEFSEESLKNALPAFLGVRLQTPPNISAVKVEGKRAHAAARAGEKIEIAPRPVNITSIQYCGRTEQGEALLRVDCHRGTYIRSLARDLGRCLGLGAHLSGLRRLNVGGFCHENALFYNPQQTISKEALEQAILPVSSIASQYYCYEANSFCEKRLSNGLCVFVDYLQFRNAGRVPIDCGIVVLGRELLCLGALRKEKGRSVIYPQVNIPREILL